MSPAASGSPLSPLVRPGVAGDLGRPRLVFEYRGFESEKVSYVGKLSKQVESFDNHQIRGEGLGGKAVLLTVRVPRGASHVPVVSMEKGKLYSVLVSTYAEERGVVRAECQESDVCA